MTASRTAIPAPTYVLIADLSSLVIRPAAIGSPLLNPRSTASVKAEYDYASFFASQVVIRAAFRHDDNTTSILPGRIACDWLRQTYGQRIQIGSVVCDD